MTAKPSSSSMPAARASSSSCSRSERATGLSGASRQIDGIGTHPAPDRQGSPRGRCSSMRRWPRRGRATCRPRSTRSSAFLRQQLGGRLPARSATGSSTAGPTTARRPLSTRRCSTGSSASSRSLRCTSRTTWPRSARSCGAQPQRAAGGLLRHGLPSRPPRGRRPLCDPGELYAEGVRRYGFHGLSYEYIADAWARSRLRSPMAGSSSRISAAARPCARSSRAEASKARWASPRSTACRWARGPGQLDAGVVLYLMSEKGMSAKAIERLLYNDCGLKGLVRHQQRRARAAGERRSARQAGARLLRLPHRAALPGCSPPPWAASTASCSPPGSARTRRRSARRSRGGSPGSASSSTSEANAKGELLISRKRSRVACYVIPTDEELMIAEHTLDALRAHAAARQRRNEHDRPLFAGPAQGQEGAGHRHRQRPIDRLGMRQGLPRVRRRSRRSPISTRRRSLRRAAGQGGRGADLHAARPASRASSRPCSSAIKKKWGKLDIVLHSIAFAPKDDLQGRVVDCSKEGFLLAMEISCWSFIRMAKLAEPLMKDGGTLFTMTYYGSQMVVENYNIMGPVKAALEVATRYMAAELGPEGHQGPRNLPRSAQDPCRLGHQRLRRAPAEGAGQGAGAQPGLDRGCRRRRRLPRP